MADLIIIRGPWAGHHHYGKGRTHLLIDRLTLAKKRWRGLAENGTEFGFDLEHPLGHSAHFFSDETGDYFIEQKPEPVFEIPFHSTEEAARIAWNIGNLHFGLQLLPNALRVADDPALVQFLSREKIAHRRLNEIFLPMSAGAHHHHHDSHG